MKLKSVLKFFLLPILALPAGCDPSQDIEQSGLTLGPDGTVTLGFGPDERSAWTIGTGVILNIMDSKKESDQPIGAMLALSPLPDMRADAGVSYLLPDTLATSLEGQSVEVIVTARFVRDGGADLLSTQPPVAFAVAASNGSNSVPWSTHSTSDQYQGYSYKFFFPTKPESLGSSSSSSRLHIWPDVSGSGATLLVKSILLKLTSEQNAAGGVDGTEEATSVGQDILAAAGLAMEESAVSLSAEPQIYKFDAQEMPRWQVGTSSSLALVVDPETGRSVGQVNADAAAPLRRRLQPGVARSIDEDAASLMAGYRVRVTIRARKAAESANVGFGLSLRNQQQGTRWHFFQPASTYRDFSFDTLFPGEKDGGGKDAAVSLWGDALGRSQPVLIESVKIEQIEAPQDTMATNNVGNASEAASSPAPSASNNVIVTPLQPKVPTIVTEGASPKTTVVTAPAQQPRKERPAQPQVQSGHQSQQALAAKSAGLISTAGRLPGQFMTSAEYPGSHIMHLASYTSQRLALRGWRLLSARHPAILEGETPILTEAYVNGTHYVRLSASALDRMEAKRRCKVIQAAGDYCNVILK